MSYGMQVWNIEGQLIFQAGPARTAQYRFAQSGDGSTPGSFDCSALDTKTQGVIIMPAGGDYYLGWNETFFCANFLYGEALMPQIYRDTVNHTLDWGAGLPIDLFALELS
jgi:hypothetical protein